MRHQWETGATALSIHRDALRVNPDAAADVMAILETRAHALPAYGQSCSATSVAQMFDVDPETTSRQGLDRVV